MSKIQVNEIVNHFDTGAPDCPKGLTVTGVTTSVNISATNVSVIGVSTLGNVVVGGATTDLVVTGDARITGILTVGTASVTLNGNDGIISGINTVNDVSFPSTGPLSNRNLIINGAMNVAQRGTSNTGLTAGSYPTVDRFPWSLSSCGTWTSTQESDGPTGFSKSFKMLCTTADASPASTDYAVLQYVIEAQDLQHLNYGTSDAVPLTVSFWVKSNKTGNASFACLQYDASLRTFSKQYTINAANTWEYKTITIPADASGQFDDDNGQGLLLEWWSNSGTNYTSGSHPTTWTELVHGNRNASNIGIGQAVNDYFQITGIQLEVGTQATPFEHRSFGDELKRCERYFEKSYTYASPPGTTTSNGVLAGRKAAITSSLTNLNVRFGTRKRATPTIGLYSPDSSTEGLIKVDSSDITGNDQDTNEMGFWISSNPGGAANVICSAHYTADAEL